MYFSSAGNPGLVRVLPQIYEENKDLIKKQIPELMNVMPSCETAELANLLQLFVTIAKCNPEVKTDEYFNVIV
jgi:hypothetical protein